uniref:hypothetical protein n=2 Tax=Roseivirga sp. TaxID=1964215 RepID=UPI004048876A
MFKKVLRIFTFGILGMTLHSFGTVAQEQGEEVLLPLPKPVNIAQDSLTGDFSQENKPQSVQLGMNSKSLLPEVGISQTNKLPENKANQSKIAKKDDSQSNLSFNFLYYIFYKFKPSDVLEKK